MVGHSLVGVGGVSGPAVAAGATGFCCKVQADGAGPVVVCDSAPPDDAGIHDYFREDRQDSHGRHSPVLFYLCGLLGWNYFAQTFSAAAGTFTSNANLFGKVYFPRLVLPASNAIGNVFALILNLGIFLAFWLYFRLGTDDFSGPPDLFQGLALLPLLVLLTASVSLGCGLWMAVLTAKYRDLTHVTGFLLQLWLYATPVIYPLSQVTGIWKTLAVLNPMTCVVEGYRVALLGVGHVPPHLLAVSLCLTFFFLVSSLLAFNRTERTFIDTV